jgi:hypothetical protein
MPSPPIPGTSLPPWDSNGTNQALAIGSSHQTDGYAIDEVPTSTELNLLLYLMCGWITYLINFVSAATWKWLAPTDVESEGSVGVPFVGQVGFNWQNVVFGTSGAFTTCTVGDATFGAGIIAITISPKVGDVITSIGIIAENAVSLGNLALSAFNPSTGTYATVPGGLSGNITGSGASAWKFEYVLSTPYTVTDVMTGTASAPLQVALLGGAGAGNVYKLIALGYQSKQPLV